MTTITIDRAVVEEALKTLEYYQHRKLEWDFSDELAVGDLRAALAQSVPHGCHVDLDHGMKPDGCVLDDGRPENCIYAKRLLREGKDKTACEYWQPIEVTR